VRALLITGSINFGEAVAKYSNDETLKYTGGKLQSKNGDTYLPIDELDANMVALLKDLNVGQYSQPTEYTDERGRKGIRLVYLESRSNPHRENLKDDYNRVAQRALEEKKNEALEKWFASKVPTYYIMLDDEFKTCDEMEKWTKGMGIARKQ
jgi:peptidyl-prolyl cis-trans isomerase SurA